MLRAIQRLTAITFITTLILVATGLVALRLNHGNALSVQSESMVPTLNKGDLITVSSIPASNLQIGDIVTYRSPKDPKITITHRLVGTPRELGGDNFETKGDGNQAPDPFITSGAIVGRVNYAIPILGYVADFLRKPLGLLFLIYLPAILILGSEVRRLIRYYRLREEYVAPGYKPEHESHHFRHVHIVRLFWPVLCVPLIVASPTVAALRATTVLSGTTIQTVPLNTGPRMSPVPSAEPPDRHVVISEVNLPCTDGQNAATSNPTIVLYNSKWQAVDIGGWRLRDARGLLKTIPSAVNLAADEFYTIALTDLTDGLQHAGDRLVLYDASDKEVDGMSWGGDMSSLSPALAPPTIGTKFLRPNPLTDSNQPSDWYVVDTDCTIERL